MTRSTSRLVVVGRNSTVWRRVRKLVDTMTLELSHNEVERASIDPDDVVWILAYGRHDKENERLFTALSSHGVRNMVYISSATAPVGAKYPCYSYPRSKLRAERLAVDMLSAHVVRLGIVYENEEELPGGRSLATKISSIADAMRVSLRVGPHAVPPELFELHVRPFGSRIERRLYDSYGRLICSLPTPCLLRPLDLAFRIIGWRWYGYVYLSNREWPTTT
jgi:hypothetical protein